MDYDVIIVGGRPAGASLAARLGARGMRVLVVDRATFPSLPGVPSSPVLHDGTMRLLDELGIPESSYADDHARMRNLRFEMSGYFGVHMKVPAFTSGRDYVYGVDRSSFDDILWRNLARFPKVERRQDFAVSDLLREGDQVTGIIGGKPEERITAGCVVGADGRFSLVARRAGAAVVEEETAHCSTVYYADWEGVRPFNDQVHGGMICATARGLDVIFFAMPGGRYSVNTHARADRVVIDGDPARYYQETLRSLPLAAKHLEGARQVTPLVGIKKIGNGYRRASGPGWVLVGDALHYKDPVDGQGIYDALLETKILDEAIAGWNGGRPWTEAMAGYERAVREATYGMYTATKGRLQRELYQEPPAAVIKTMIRWMMSDPAYQELFMRFLARDVPAERLTSKSMMGGAMLRGLGRDVRGLFRRNSS
jgi:2-polyprenyl-6-methoxyphenol hydroxylase-like FAD-dependent oxidoreductase